MRWNESSELLAASLSAGPGLLDVSAFNRCAQPEQLDPEAAALCREFFDAYLRGQSMELKVPMLVAFCALFAVGCAGNALVILSVAIFPAMRSRTNLFLLNLAVSDLLIFFICLPVAAYNLVASNWIFGDAVCKLSPFLQGVSVSVSVGSLASMSVKRYMVIRFPMTAKRRMSHRAMAAWLGGIWAAAALLCCPIPIVYARRTRRLFWQSSLTSCEESWPSPATKKAYTLFLFCALYLLPLAAMTVFYSMLGRALVSTVRFTRQVTGDASCQQPGLRAIGRGRVKVSKMMIALLLAFAVCWLPYHAVSIFVDLRLPAAGANHTQAAGAEYSVAMTTVLPLCLLLGYANSAVNPLCLLLISSKFKKYFRLILTCDCGADARESRARSEAQHLHSVCTRQHRHDAAHLHHLREQSEMEQLHPACRQEQQQDCLRQRQQLEMEQLQPLVEQPPPDAQ